MTRSAIEAQLDALRSKIPNRWWVPYAFLGAALVTGIALSRLPILRFINTGAKTVQTGVAVAGALGAAQKLLGDRPSRRAA